MEIREKQLLDETEKQIVLENMNQVIYQMKVDWVDLGNPYCFLMRRGITSQKRAFS